jgi:hypothetical protein
MGIRKQRCSLLPVQGLAVIAGGCSTVLNLNKHAFCDFKSPACSPVSTYVTRSPFCDWHSDDVV